MQDHNQKLYCYLVNYVFKTCLTGFHRATTRTLLQLSLSNLSKPRMRINYKPSGS